MGNLIETAGLQSLESLQALFFPVVFFFCSRPTLESVNLGFMHSYKPRFTAHKRAFRRVHAPLGAIRELPRRAFRRENFRCKFLLRLLRFYALVQNPLCRSQARL